MKSISKKYGIDNEIYCESKATSFEEIGNDIYPPIKKVLTAHNIPFDTHKARRIDISDLNNFDLIIGMDSYNISNIKRILGDSNKIHKLAEFSKSNVDVDDPWYTRDFESCYEEIYMHIRNLCEKLKG